MPVADFKTCCAIIDCAFASGTSLTDSALGAISVDSRAKHRTELFHLDGTAA